jgi:hypothetical protein
MKLLNTIMAGSTGLALLAGAAAPAAAQYGNQGYGNPGGNVVGEIINNVLGGGRYGTYGQGTNRMAVDQCARAAEARVNANPYGNGQYGRYGQQGYGSQGYGYPNNDPRYAQNVYNQVGARVVAVTNVGNRAGMVQVSGLIDTNNVYSNRGYQGQPGYNDPRYPQQGYGDPRYPQPGYGQPGMDPRYGGWNNQGYANAATTAELRFNCRVDSRGQITRLKIDNNTQYRRAY